MSDIRWAVNVLLEKIAAKFEAWETMDIWRSDAASTVRSFKHDLTGDAAQRTVKSGILTLDVEGWAPSVRVHDGGYEVSITEDGKCPASHYVRLDHEQADTLRDFMIETSPAQPPVEPVQGCDPCSYPNCCCWKSQQMMETEARQRSSAGNVGEK